MQNLDTNTIWL